MNALLIYITLSEPVLVMDVNSGDPNSANSLDYIPGSAIRGALIRQFLHHTGQAQIDAEDSQFRSLFLDGKVRFLNAYPESAVGQRMLPTPLSWYVNKDHPEKVFDFAIGPQGGTAATWQLMTQPFCSLTSTQEVDLQIPQMQINIHIARADRQRVAQSGSSVFRYRAIASDQTFVAVVISENEDLLKQLNWLTPDTTIFIGKSHLAGYGAVSIRKVVSLNDWQEYQPVGDDQPDLALTLLSDTLLRDPKTGAYTMDITEALGIKQPVKTAFIGTAIAGGFNRKWNLPLPQAEAVRAGSTWVFEHDLGLEGQLRSFELSGIGERTAEGFGRIAINWAGVESLKIEPESKINRILNVELTGESADLAHSMVDRILRARLDQYLIRKIESSRIIKQPVNHQLSRLRTVMLQVIRDQSMQSLEKWLVDLKPTAQKQFQNARFENKPFYEWLKEQPHHQIWTILGADVSPTSLPQLGGILPDLEKMAIEYTARLVDGVVQKAVKTEKEAK